MWYSKKVLFYFRLIFPIFFYGVDSIFVCIFFVFFFMVCFFFTIDVGTVARKRFGEPVTVPAAVPRGLTSPLTSLSSYC